MGDRYPRGDPEGFDPRQQAIVFARLGIDLTIFRVTPQIDMMIEKFHMAYKDSLATGLFTVLDVEKQLNSVPHIDSYEELDMDRGLSDDIYMGEFESCVSASVEKHSDDVFKTGLIASASASVNRRK